MATVPAVDLNCAHGTYPLRGLRFFTMRAQNLLKTTLAALSLSLGLLVGIAPSHALTLEKVSAPWVDIYRAAASASNSATVPHVASTSASPQGKHVNLLSTFKVTYTNVPIAEQTAVQAAIDTWSDNWSSSVPVNVVANFVPEGTSGILASASPVSFFHNFAGAPDSTLWYSSAMANALAGKDLDPANPEISININSTMANVFYLGTDGNCPTNQYDLESIILHEVAHGLGFLSNDSFDSFSQYGSIDQPTPFDAYTQTADGGRLMDLASPSISLGIALQNTLVWSGKNGIAANNGIKPALYTPSRYEPGSSVSHLDETTFQGSGPDALMTPAWPGGAVFHSPGPLVLAMLADMRLKPPAGIPVGIPNAPRNVFAIVGNKSAIVSFDPPDNARTSQVTSYAITVNETGKVVQATSSPVTISGLVNGSHYSFSVTASNQLGVSPAQTSNAIFPQAPWKSTVLDPVSDAKYLATTTFQGSPTVAYTDSKSGDLKLAMWNGKSWVMSTVDGNSKVGGRTKDNVAGYVSMCTSAAGKNQRLDIVYADLSNKQLRYAGFNGKSWKFTVVDGNGANVIKYNDINRVRTASDVSGASACADTADGLQIFYRDQSEGIILAAVQLGSTIGNWEYQVVDGDAQLNGRTTGDVGFHLKALNIGRTIYLLYDSILQVNQQRLALQGEVRLATRSSAYAEDWKYSALDSYGGDIAVAGYDVALAVVGRTVTGIWMAASGTSIPNPNQLRIMDITNNGPVISASTAIYGTPTAPLSTDGIHSLFNCQNRLCAINDSDQTVSLVTTADMTNSLGAAWVTINKVRYALVGVGGKLQLFKAT